MTIKKLLYVNTARIGFQQTNLCIDWHWKLLFKWIDI